MEKGLKNEIMSHFSGVIDVEIIKDNLYLLNHDDKFSFCLFDNKQKKQSVSFDSFEEINTDLYLASVFGGSNYFINTKTLWASSQITRQEEIAPGIYIATNSNNRYDRKLISPAKCLEQEDWSMYSYPNDGDVSDGFVFLLKKGRFDTSLVLIRLSDLKESGPISVEFNRKVEYFGDEFIALSLRENPKVKALINKSNLAACKVCTAYDKFDIIDNKFYSFNFESDWSIVINIETMETSSFLKNKKPFRDGISIAETVDNRHVIIRDSSITESRHFVSYEEFLPNILMLKRKDDSDDITLFNLNTFEEEDNIYGLKKITEKLYSKKQGNHVHLIDIETFKETSLGQTVRCELENGVITCYSKAGSKSTLDDNLVQSAFQF